MMLRSQPLSPAWAGGEKGGMWWRGRLGVPSLDRVIARYQRTLMEMCFELAIVLLFLKAYNLVRNLFGSVKCKPEFALAHALQVMDAERYLGIFWEQEIQAMVLHWRGWMRAWNIFYGAAHTAVTAFVLGYLFVLKPTAYQRCRTVFIVMNVLAIIGYAGYPLMPPRLVNACDDPYGGCLKEYTFVDSLHAIGGFWSWKDSGMSKVSNQYAAMPSMHFGYALWCAASFYRHGAQHPALRAAAAIYPMLTLYCIVVTANHYFLDALFGALAFWVASCIAGYFPRVGRGADDSDMGCLSDSPSRPSSPSDKQGGLLLPITEPLDTESSSPGSESPTAVASLVKSVRITLSTLQKR